MAQSMCLCSTVRDLATTGVDERRAMLLASDLNKHLAAIHTILAKSKPLNRNVHWQLIPSNQRTRKIFSVQSLDATSLDRLCDSLGDNTDAFWSRDDSSALAEVRRRFACAAVFLRSVLDPDKWVSPAVARLVQGSKLSELRFAGKKYLKIARRLGGIGSLFWLPTEVPSSTYERYLNMDDDEAFAHLASLGTGLPSYDDLAQRLIFGQVNDPSLRLSYHNLFVEYGDILPISDHLTLLTAGFGGVNVPCMLFESVRGTKGRWTDEGEAQSTTATEFGLPSRLVESLSGRQVDAAQCPDIETSNLDDGTPCWSINSKSQEKLAAALSPQTQEALASTALRLICFATPPCYEGKSVWSRQLNSCIWGLLQKAMSQHQCIPMSLRRHVIEALLFFSERGLMETRYPAIERARALLHKSLPYYYQASVTLFESNILRVNGDLGKSDAVIHDFLGREHQPSNRCENALLGRLHVSLLENKIARYDKDVAVHMYNWKGIQPLSTFEIEVTRRLQGVAAKFFSTIGDFQTARASMEQHLTLNTTIPIRPNTRYLITCKLSEVHCELGEFDEAVQLIQPEMETIPEARWTERPFRRFALALSEARLGLGQLDKADETLSLLAKVEPPELDDINAQTLHMRRLINTARMTHEKLDFTEAIEKWELLLKEFNELTIFQSRHKWIQAIFYLSIAHARLQLGDQQAAREAWDLAVGILRSETVEYVLPTLATRWLKKIVDDVHQAQQWPFRVMLPGGKPDVTWPSHS